MKEVAKPPSKVLRQSNRNHFFPSEYKELMASRGSCLVEGGCQVEGGVRARIVDTGRKVRMTDFPSTEHGMGRGLGKFPRVCTS